MATKEEQLLIKDIKAWSSIANKVFVGVLIVMIPVGIFYIKSMNDELIIAKQQRMHMSADIAENKKFRKETQDNIEDIKLSLVGITKEYKSLNKTQETMQKTLDKIFDAFLQKNRSVEIETDPSKVDEVNLCEAF